ncbi:MAG: polysaccharide deacetylase family protein [Bacteroidales bacterium]|nr:polysaccharide deacetylase family protein [Bacteroidales bacterium]
MLVRPYLIMNIFHDKVIWRGDRNDRIVYLTFDDGPTPHTTEAILEILEVKNVKATFFCVGDNVRKYPHLYETITSFNHETGNHTFHHLNGWKTSTNTYVENVIACESFFQTPFFRPPYGKLTYSQYLQIKQRYLVVMWDTLSMDYASTETHVSCLKRLIRYTRFGSVVVFHDNVKSRATLLKCLPAYLDFLKNEGYTCRTITDFVIKKVHI